MHTDKDIERALQDKDKTAPRITPEHVEARIVSEHYFTAQDGVMGSTQNGGPLGPAALDLLTFCVLVLRNGFTVTGESACVSAENFDAEIGRTVARQKAVEKIWMLEGYALKERLNLSAYPEKRLS